MILPPQFIFIICILVSPTMHKALFVHTVVLFPAQKSLQYEKAGNIWRLERPIPLSLETSVLNESFKRHSGSTLPLTSSGQTACCVWQMCFDRVWGIERNSSQIQSAYEMINGHNVQLQVNPSKEIEIRLFQSPLIFCHCNRHCSLGKAELKIIWAAAMRWGWFNSDSFMLTAWCFKCNAVK